MKYYIQPMTEAIMVTMQSQVMALSPFGSIEGTVHGSGTGLPTDDGD